MTRLEWLTYGARLTAPKGSQLPHAKLDEQTAASILREFVPYSRTHGARALARRYGVHVNTIWKLTARDTWAHVRAA